ncbi:hypothetical protein [Piscirickettsia salmonis]|nr:hypothetical protein [Piscirickettsia salmonis]
MKGKWKWNLKKGKRICRLCYVLRWLIVGLVVVIGVFTYQYFPVGFKL